VGGLAVCRNSVGAECYVADEIITSRAGVRVRIGNTDAEGEGCGDGEKDGMGLMVTGEAWDRV
jgi:hypothetical protein